jgi:sugar phosphate isomerase/epimerase
MTHCPWGKLALCNEVVRDLAFEDQCALAKDLGYDGLEIAPFTLSDQPHRLPPAQRAELKTIARDHGIAITGLHWLLLKPDGLSITDPGPAIRAETIDVMKGLIELTVDLGGTILVHGSPKQRAIGLAETRETAMKRAADAFAAIAEAAAAAGVTYCIEALAKAETEVINTVDEAAAIVRAIDNPAVRTMVDCCAAGQSESVPVADLLERWLPSGLIAHIHLNDPNRRGPGQGDMTFAPILAALHRHDFQGIAAVEPFIYEPDGPTTAARAIGYIWGIAESGERR